MTHLHVRFKASATEVEESVVYQSPQVAAALPFAAADGTEVRVVGQRPYVGVVNGKLVVGLRGPECPDQYRYAPVSAKVPEPRQAAKKAAAAVAELRRHLNSRQAIHACVDAFGGKI